MSKYTYKRLNLTPELAKVILENKPTGEGEIYWNREINVYYTKGPRRNALVYCKENDTWRTSVRYNHEIEELVRYIPLSIIANLKK
ncbi:TPA: hypothetical protein VAM27_003007 [Acinetobacter baumannii]|uniref:Uncharacterized protein n=1 Tax=Acinetobacter baumannii (strain 1295743) TaxID=1310613 RepID=A0A009HGD6_ACIB9|nr:hypothetical protein [Acinetobacter baumannii]HCA5286868.1 hypothetical protein [Acinetobacter nosocomialis]EXB03272.1 hypothetical protein J512_4208 [Acinetobacter baumannii 1295743]MCQ1074013.1 hypothetical protein [Acinetobacter baumannii]MDC5567260.1 hypothetical protein [Acinetobacter baumannii]MDK2172876.1 hypothetical protein [Acinetobacter baumannii]